MGSMARSRLCRVCKAFHDLDEAWPYDCVGHFGIQPDQAAPYVQSDNIDAFRSQADGKVYTSKSVYRRELKARGMVELGNDQPTFRPTAPRPVREDMRRALQQRGG